MNGSKSSETKSGESKNKKSKRPPRVAIIMGSESDWPVMKQASDVLYGFDIAHELRVLSAHRTPIEMLQFAENAEGRGLQVIIAGAGGAAHLPGMVASHTHLPVVGVPIDITSLKGLDSLLSIVQMPKGVPVATMAVDNATNAGLFAARILALNDAKLKEKLTEYHAKQQQKVFTADENLSNLSRSK
jgi:5-(carboxyamino)imidazole ribonucleotide mutase